MTNKTLIALAVSAAIAAPAAQAAEFQINDKTMFAVEGTLEPVYISQNDGDGDSQSEFADNDSTLQFVGEHAWTESTTGFFHVEYEWDGDEKNGGVDNLDSAYLGMKGEFGMLRAGTSDTLYDDAIEDFIDVFENGGLTGEADGGEGNQVRYVTPNFSGFSAGVELKIEGDGEDELDATDDGDLDPDTPGIQADAVASDPDDSATGVAAMARYDGANWGVAISADNRAASYVDTDDDGTPEDFDDETTTGFGGYYEIADFRFSGRFASESNQGNDTDVEYAGVIGSYDYGAGDVYLGLQEVAYDDDATDDRTEVAAMVMHNLYDNLDLFVGYAQYDKENDQDDLTELGAIYSF